MSVVSLLAVPLFGPALGVRLVAVPLLFTAALAAAIAGGVLALIAILRERDHSVGVFVATIPLLFCVVFTLIEVLALVLVGGEP